jgi:hypothetical protein
MVALCRVVDRRCDDTPAYTPRVIDHDETLAGGPALDRQERPVRLDVRGRPILPSRVPEPKPTPLQGVFIYLSIGVLFSGVIAIMALELGTPMSSPWVKVPVLLGGALLLAVTVDAVVRVWRSASAWMPVHRGTGLFRLVWAAVLAGSLLVIAAVMAVVLTA